MSSRDTASGAVSSMREATGLAGVFRAQSSSTQQEQRLAQAADWLLRLRDPAVTPAEIAEWMSWCDAAPENKAAFSRMQALWRDSGAIEEHTIDAKEISTDKYQADMSIAHWRKQTAHPTFSPLPLPRGRGQGEGGSFLSRKTIYRVAAAAAIAVIATTLFLTTSPTLPQRDLKIATTTGVNRSVTLPDGSTVTVAGSSSIATRFVTNERHVFLEQGEAYFQVKSDKNRPFIVHALGTTVTAVGTAFNIRADEGVVRVAVTEGLVDIDRRAVTKANTNGPARPRGADNIRLAAGHEVTLRRDDPYPIVVSVDTDHVIAWVSGTLKFVDEPLVTVVAAVNRYATTPIILQDPELGALRYTGTVVAGRVEEWLRGLPNVFPVSVQTKGGADVRILKRTAANPFSSADTETSEGSSDGTY